jgi:flagellar protein FlaG
METGRLSNRPPSDPVLTAGAPLRPAVSPRPAPPAAQALPGATALDTAAATSPQPRPAQRSRDDLEQLVEQLSKRAQVERHSLSFEVNDDAGLTVVSVIDRETREIIRQIPSEELVRLAEFFAQLEEQRNAEAGGLTGVLLREQA